MIPVRIKLIVYCRGSGLSWLVGVVNGIPDSMLCLTSFLVLHSTTCSWVCIHQQIGHSNTMKGYTQSLINATYFPRHNNILMGICQMLLQQLHFGIYSVLKEKNPYISTWSDLFTHSDWSNHQSFEMNNYIVRSYRDVIVITKFAITKFAIRRASKSQSIWWLCSLDSYIQNSMNFYHTQRRVQPDQCYFTVQITGLNFQCSL